MKAGDMVKFKQIVAGRDDDPPYSLDGQWRLGILIDWPPPTWLGAPVFYRGKVYRIRAENIVLLEEI